jgi:hypothetical protein
MSLRRKTIKKLTLLATLDGDDLIAEVHEYVVFADN